MNSSIDVFTKLHTLGLIFTLIFGLALMVLMREELGIDIIGNDLGNMWKLFTKWIYSTKTGTKFAKPDKMELKVLSELRRYFNQPEHSNSVIQHSRYIHLQN